MDRYGIVGISLALGIILFIYRYLQVLMDFYPGGSTTPTPSEGRRKKARFW